LRDHYTLNIAITTAVALSAMIVAGVAGATTTFFSTPLATIVVLNSVGFSAAGPVTAVGSRQGLLVLQRVGTYFLPGTHHSYYLSLS
jgi:hypothetical protein